MWRYGCCLCSWWLFMKQGDDRGGLRGRCPYGLCLADGRDFMAVGLIPLSLRLFSLSLVKNVKQRSLPEALKSYRRWSEIRTGMLVVPVLVNLSFYYLTLNNTGVLCAMMALIASLFCVPTRKRMLDELDLVKEENEEPAL